MHWKELTGFAGVGIACCVMSAGARADWGLKYEVSPNGISWGPAIVVAPGGTVYFRMGAYFDLGTQVMTSGGAGNAVIFGRVAGQQIITNTITGQDIASEMTRSVSSGGPFFLNVSNTASGILIGLSHPASWAGNTMFSGSLSLYLDNPQPSMLVFQGKLAIGTNTTPRTFTFRNNLFGTNNEPGLRFYNDVPTSPIELGAPIDSSSRTDLNATIQVSTASCGVPTINSVSGSTSASPSQPATFTVSASNAAFYAWVKNGAIITQTGHYMNAGTATMTIPFPESIDAASYQVRVYSLCGASVLSNPISLTITCAADLNGDGFVDDTDFTWFAANYENLLCEDFGCASDFNLDGMVDDADFVVFAAQYDQLICP